MYRGSVHQYRRTSSFVNNISSAGVKTAADSSLVGASELEQACPSDRRRTFLLGWRQDWTSSTTEFSATATKPLVKESFSVLISSSVNWLSWEEDPSRLSKRLLVSTSSLSRSSVKNRSRSETTRLVVKPKRRKIKMVEHWTQNREVGYIFDKFRKEVKNFNWHKVEGFLYTFSRNWDPTTACRPVVKTEISLDHGTDVDADPNLKTME